MATIARAVTGALRLQGKVAVITGAASGIGEETAKTFVAHGAKVIIADIQDAAGEKLARELGGPDTARFIHCDVSQEEDVAAAVDLSVSAYGGLHVMFNNAGVLVPGCPLEETSMVEFDRSYGVLLKGAVMGVKHAARVMKPMQTGSIITTASVAAHIAGPSMAYTTLKHALLGLTRYAAWELRDFNIRANTISPGAICTPIMKDVPKFFLEQMQASSFFPKMKTSVSHKIAGPDSIANAALFLASDDSAYVSGEDLAVDGSHMLQPGDPLREA
ncbi:hypothetical protein MPTK1_3g24690 [Marchantia polymorpha subsp. ruderalis]|uniref:Uncharacterized protein n=2 Tax=Marchantia polymorpha TaxID=3197 RepID=A0AAF6B4F5_MARPO|nr:hypothetical protein MARPO_0183s0001 [Marchantia polymorpha]PTQ27794.1 hypothetical protein MARPO_0183s0001 [Marchantia polymorpha]BBN06888.1 hypothetical protein Mp_3g24690 [Marchantia polymorpha subsp. ruderalis]BBN06889.1 hypothetical protein Mp_3g24690 [Marchantia polymorpha subsp. ruderalis]|eukprot:PTQ27793.1 hypothetical protein MARPO_0183s0001 [Marchantia polymorpha]